MACGGVRQQARSLDGLRLGGGLNAPQLLHEDFGRAGASLAGRRAIYDSVPRVAPVSRHVENRPGRDPMPLWCARRDVPGGAQQMETAMPVVTHVYWRDIPAQVIVGKGRRGAKAPLPERFEQAIDRVAMRIGARDEDAYLREWRRVEIGEREGEPSEIAAAEAARLDATFDAATLKTLIDADGFAPAAPEHLNRA
jgi:hypothetical protein